MHTTLGLDIGTNSIGWALIEDNIEIKDMGVRIFPVGVKEDDYNKSGSEVSKNAARRSARGIRRLYFRYKLRRKQLKNLLFKLEMLPPETMVFTASQLYGLRKKALDEQISLKELGKIFLLLNQRRGFKSSKKGDNKKDDAAKERSEMKIKMNELTQKVYDSNCRTVGEYFYSLFLKTTVIENWHNPDEPVERIRTRFVYRKLYEDEFDLIWNKQKEFYPETLTDENYKKIKDNCIFYQRPLKSQKHLVGKCRFEPKKRVAPKSSFEFQEFRIWQTISNLRITGDLRFRDKLNIEEKNLLAKSLNKEYDLSKSQIKKILGFPRNYNFQNDMPDKIKGNITYSKLINALGYDYFDNLPAESKYKLWHTLFFANDEEWLEKYALEKLCLNKEQTKNYIEIDLEPDYSNISVKAIKKILPFMKSGQDYAEACVSARYHHSFDEEKDSLERELKDKIEGAKDDNLRNPLVQQSVSESIRLVNEVIKEYGKPDTIRVELARQLKMPKDRREKIKRNNDEKQKRRESYIEFLKKKLKFTTVGKSEILKFELWLEMEFAENDLTKIKSDIDIDDFKKFAKNVKPQDKEKYYLWLECERICPYTGEIISLSELFSSEIEVEHIIPYSLCMDDSFSNKTLAKRWFNKDKGNRTPYQYFKNNPEEWNNFKERIKNFSDGKQAKFTIEQIPDDFINQQLNNTAYIAKEVRKKLKTVCRNVRITNGQATSHLRRFWGLNEILNPDGKNEKSRDDHRHHAIDALVIANTTDRYIQLLSIGSQFDYTGKMKLRNVEHPFPNFKQQAIEKINEILVSYRNKKRLISTKTNKYIHSLSHNGKKIKNISVRGTLHEETFYGQILNPSTKENNFVVRKPLSSIDKLKQVDKIVDLSIRKIIYDHINKNGGEEKIKQALAHPVYIMSRDGEKKIPIKKVRIIETAENLIQLRSKNNSKLFVSPGNNYLFAIYDNEGIRSFETISFFDAVKRASNKLPIIKEEQNLLISLVQKDMVIIYDKHPDEINLMDRKEIFNKLYRVVKFNTNGQISLAKHNLTNINPDRPKEYPKGTVINCNYNTFKGIKVRISTLGKVIKIK